MPLSPSVAEEDKTTQEPPEPKDAAQAKVARTPRKSFVAQNPNAIAKKVKSKRENEMDLKSSECLFRIPPYDEPTSLPLKVETRHAHMLKSASLDQESQLRVFY